jgi:hypothetical protein
LFRKTYHWGNVDCRQLTTPLLNLTFEQSPQKRRYQQPTFLEVPSGQPNRLRNSASS